MNFLSNGEPVSAEDILSARELRAQRLEDLTNEYPQRTFLSLKLNIPGSIKAHPILDLVFDQALAKVTEQLTDFKIHDLTEKNTGPELILSTSLSAEKTKRIMITLEESTPIGRLYDLDVIYQGVVLSRSQFSIPDRTCLVCNQSARICSRSQAHSLKDVLNEVEHLIFQDQELAPKLKELQE